jgi:hypothetical protein
VTGCRAPKWEPSRANPGGDCGEPATRAAPLGTTGRWLPLCAEHAARHARTVPLSQVPER